MKRIAIYTVGKRGLRGWGMSLHPNWIKEHQLSVGSWLDVYRTDDGSLLIRPLQKPTN